MKNDCDALKIYFDVLEMLIDVPWQTAHTPEDFAYLSDIYDEYHSLLVQLLDIIRKNLEK